LLTSFYIPTTRKLEKEFEKEKQELDIEVKTA
jgi:hypothetical protein